MSELRKHSNSIEHQNVPSQSETKPLLTPEYVIQNAKTVEGISLDYKIIDVLNKYPSVHTIFVTGKPGTGKTTIGEGIIHSLKSDNYQCVSWYFDEITTNFFKLSGLPEMRFAEFSPLQKITWKLFLEESIDEILEHTDTKHTPKTLNIIELPCVPTPLYPTSSRLYDDTLTGQETVRMIASRSGASHFMVIDINSPEKNFIFAKLLREALSWCKTDHVLKIEAEKLGISLGEIDINKDPHTNDLVSKLRQSAPGDQVEEYRQLSIWLANEYAEGIKSQFDEKEPFSLALNTIYHQVTKLTESIPNMTHADRIQVVNDVLYSEYRARTILKLHNKHPFIPVINPFAGTIIPNSV